MTRLFLLGTAGLALAACASDQKAEAFICSNGPDLTAFYSDDSVLLQLNDERDIVLTRPDPARPNFYAGNEVSWSVTERDARLNIDRKSYLCDKLS